MSLETHLLSLPAGHEEAVYCTSTRNGRSLRITWKPRNTHDIVGHQHCFNYFVDMKMPNGQWIEVVRSGNSSHHSFDIEVLLGPTWWYQDGVYDVVPSQYQFPLGRSHFTSGSQIDQERALRKVLTRELRALGGAIPAQDLQGWLAPAELV